TLSLCQYDDAAQRAGLFFCHPSGFSFWNNRVSFGSTKTACAFQKISDYIRRRGDRFHCREIDRSRLVSRLTRTVSLRDRPEPDLSVRFNRSDASRGEE